MQVRKSALFALIATVQGFHSREIAPRTIYADTNGHGHSALHRIFGVALSFSGSVLFGWPNLRVVLPAEPRSASGRQSSLGPLL